MSGPIGTVPLKAILLFCKLSDITAYLGGYVTNHGEFVRWIGWTFVLIMETLPYLGTIIPLWEGKPHTALQTSPRSTSQSIVLTSGPATFFRGFIDDH